MLTIAAMNTTQAKRGYNLAIKYFGDGDRPAAVAKMSALLEITKQAVYMWGLRIPKGAAFELESKTKGKLKAADLHPPKKAIPPGKRRGQLHAR